LTSEQRIKGFKEKDSRKEEWFLPIMRCRDSTKEISGFQRHGGGVFPVPVREGRSIEVMKTPRMGTTH
jgi:hypothetical protein